MSLWYSVYNASCKVQCGCICPAGQILGSAPEVREGGTPTREGRGTGGVGEEDFGLMGLPKAAHQSSHTPSTLPREASTPPTDQGQQAGKAGDAARHTGEKKTGGNTTQ